MRPPPSSPPLPITSAKPVIVAALLAALLLPVVAAAQEGLGPGRRAKSPNICMTDPELEAEAIVRAGMVIRDHARACARRGLDGTILPTWGKFDEANAENFREAVQLRSRTYKKLWPNDPYAEQRANNATVASRQLADFAPEECMALGDLVETFKDWPSFMRHVRSTELGQVKSVYKRCGPPKRPGVAQ